MRLLSVEIEGIDRVVEVVGDELVPLKGLSEIGAETTIEAVRDAERDWSRRVPAAAAKLRQIVPRPGKVFCVGLNYLSHVEETKRDLPEYPVLFPKYGSSLIAPDADIQLPPESSQVDYEAELAIVIGRAGRRIPEDEAEEYILGYTVANDITMRDYQYKTHQWLQGKAWDASTPLGPALVTREEVDTSDLRISTKLNGEILQDSRTSLLMFSVSRLISIVSEFTALEPGDIILTGTPSGVGFRREPQVFLRNGDVVEVEIEGIGRITNRVVAEQIS
jgi:acylpyruvate hydrolase